MSAMPTHILHHKRRGVLIKLGKEIQRDNREQFRLSFCCGDEEYARHISSLIHKVWEKRMMKKIYLKKLLYIAVPIILSNIIGQLQMLIDRVFLGRMNSMYMSALGNVNSPVWTTMSFCFSIVTGASILISQGVGAGDTEKTREYASSMMKWSNVLPVLLFLFWTFCSRWVFQMMGVSDTVMKMCLGYIRFYAPIFLVIGMESSCMVILQTSNYTKPLVLFGIVRAGLNVLLDWILIFGKFGLPALGIEGAAIATTIAEYAGFLYAMYVFMTCKQLHTRPKLSEIAKAKLMPYLKSVGLGIHTALEDFAWNLGNLMLIRILNTINEMAAGIYSIVFGVEVLVVVVIGAIGNGTMTLTGEAKGRKDLAQYKGIVSIAYFLSAAVSVIMLVVCFLKPDMIIGLFTTDQAVIRMCGLYLMIMCFNLFAKAGNIVVGNGIRGSGDTRWMFLTQIFGTCFVVACAALFVFGLGLGIVGVFMAVLTDEYVRAVINLFRFQYITKHWEGSEAKESLL